MSVVWMPGYLLICHVAFIVFNFFHNVIYFMLIGMDKLDKETMTVAFVLLCDPNRHEVHFLSLKSIFQSLKQLWLLIVVVSHWTSYQDPAGPFLGFKVIEVLVFKKSSHNFKQPLHMLSLEIVNIDLGFVFMKNQFLRDEAEFDDIRYVARNQLKIGFN